MVGLVARLGHCLGVPLLLSQGPLVVLVHRLHAGLVGLGMLLLHELLDERQAVAQVLGLTAN